MPEYNKFWIHPQLRDDQFLQQIYEFDKPENGGNKDRRISLKEIQGQEIPDQPDFTVESESDFNRLRNVVATYEDLSLNHACFTSPHQKWHMAWQTQNILTECEWDLPIDVLQLKPRFDGNDIAVQLVTADTFALYADLHLSHDPEQSYITLEDSQSFDLYSLPHKWMEIISDVVIPSTNEILKDPSYSLENRVQIRDTLFQNADLLTDNYYAELYVDDDWKPKTTAQEVADIFFEQIPNQILSAGHDEVMLTYPYHQDFMHSHCLFEINSSDNITEIDRQKIATLFSNLPNDFQDYLAYLGQRQEGKLFDIILLSDDEFKKINPQAGGMYSASGNNMYLNRDMIDTLETQSIFVHKFCHAIFDAMEPNTWASKAYSIGMIPLWFAQEFKQLMPYDRSEYLKNLMAMLFGFRTIQPLTPLIKRPYLYYELAAGAGMYAIDDAKHFVPDAEGLIGFEFSQLEDRLDEGERAIDITVSRYASSLPAELAAETLSAYAYTYQEILETGYVPCYHSIGTRYREELNEKHPTIFLAYEAFFAKDSPCRFDSNIFKEETLPLIVEALANNTLEDGSIDMTAARKDLFQSLHA